ncbi:Tetraspanin-33 [Takifugu flavidus]|uniref:Tetraspanin-33 n=1 Tax=Takifugu flavidus TaxID=433684 RepID=A0A5C6MY40_9TELE|nr:Tetraspanin-33 [Takifugu flavidus]
MRGYRTIKYTLFTFCYCFWVSPITHTHHSKKFCRSDESPAERREKQTVQSVMSPAEPAEVVSAVLTAVGIYAKVAKEKDVVDTLALDPALLLIVVGSFMFLITFFGCFGALRNSAHLLKTFLGILVAVLLLQVTAGVLGYLFTDLVMERTEKLMMKTVVRYREDRDLENAIDFIQKKFQCCGVESYKDWSRNIYFLCSDANPSVEACGVPFSCCTDQQNQGRVLSLWFTCVVRLQTVLNTMCGFGMQSLDTGAAARDIFTAGCLEKIVGWTRTNMVLVGGLTAGLLLLEVCLICLASAQISIVNKVRKHQKNQESRDRAASHRKESVWLPAFADIADQ